MSDQIELEEQKDQLTSKEKAFLTLMHQRKVIMDALKNGSLSCLPGVDGYADTEPALNLVSEKKYHGTNMLFLKEHQKENKFPTAEYLTPASLDLMRKEKPDLYIRKGEHAVSLFVGEKNEAIGEWEDKNIRLFNVAQVNKPWEVKKWIEQNKQKEQHEYVEYMKTQYGDKWQPPEPKAKEPGPEIVCTTTEPAKYLGQSLAAVSLGGKFRASPEQAAEFTQKMDEMVYEKVGVSPKTGEPITNPFKLSKISNESSQYCKQISMEVRMGQKQEQPDQKLEQQQSQGQRM